MIDTTEAAPSAPRERNVFGPRQCMVGHDRAVGRAGKERRPFLRYNVVASDHSAAQLTRW